MAKTSFGNEIKNDYAGKKYPIFCFGLLYYLSSKVLTES